MALPLEIILASRATREPVVMGILNVTPDSFSDGGEFGSPDDALAQARALLDAGCELLDVGAESTRPGAKRIPAEEQITRLREVLPALCEMDVTISIDTTRAAVAEFALDCGAAILNDISAGRDDAGMLPLASARGAAICLMHMQGQPGDMQDAPRYDDVVAEVGAFLAERVAAAVAAGVPRERCIVDPGIGFGKTLEHNLALLTHVDQWAPAGCPILIGPSRKRFIAEIDPRASADNRLGGTLAACVETYRQGATIFRVHDPAPIRQALLVEQSLRAASK